MKKWTLSISLLALVIVLAACGSGNSGNKDNGTEKVYKFATEAQYAPMEYLDNGELAGFDIELLSLLMEQAGLKHTIKNIGWDALLLALKDGGEFDGAIAGITIDDDRKETYDFSKAYFRSTNLIVSAKDSSIESSLDLKDKKVGVLLSSTADVLMSELMGSSNTNLKKFESNVLAFMELKAGGIDAVVADDIVILEYLKQNPKEEFKYTEDITNLGYAYLGILLPKGENELKPKLDAALDQVFENGKYAELYKKWFGVEPDLTELKQ